MPIKVTWDNTEQTILRCEIWDEWTWDEVDQNSVVASAMIDSTGHQLPVVCLVKLINAVLPPNLIGISRHYLMAKPKRMISVIVISNNLYARGIYKALINSLSPLTKILELVSTEDDGYTAAQQRLEAANVRMNETDLMQGE